jgi:hypothetical protein
MHKHTYIRELMILSSSFSSECAICVSMFYFTFLPFSNSLCIDLVQIVIAIIIIILFLYIFPQCSHTTMTPVPMMTLLSKTKNKMKYFLQFFWINNSYCVKNK